MKHRFDKVPSQALIGIGKAGSQTHVRAKKQPHSSGLRDSPVPLLIFDGRAGRRASSQPSASEVVLPRVLTAIAPVFEVSLLFAYTGTSDVQRLQAGVVLQSLRELEEAA